MGALPAHVEKLLVYFADDVSTQTGGRHNDFSLGGLLDEAVPDEGIGSLQLLLHLIRSFRVAVSSSDQVVQGNVQGRVGMPMAQTRSAVSAKPVAYRQLPRSTSSMHNLPTRSTLFVL